ncbi:zinc ribbon domain-containing protein [Methanosphaera sp. ISO3-F5]|uniref:zinc ribbon domain-containing protein n=1 Tax=Methanosphaera sp. ISO3-F5 TaxID=1452353 RepID=UPI002B258542|nr:zinc ribbon domain-containing protein [Methanosphaera sp. ISO3-F5]WQH63682.1 zinc ribbon domain-containing protein [Methanosphaera sp. ISO3-F5]
MRLLSKNTAEEDLAKNLIKNHENEIKKVLGKTGVKSLENTLTEIAETEGIEACHNCMNYTLGRINYYKNKQQEYSIESKLADKVYDAYVTDGISRIDKVNGRFMAAQNMKLDMIIEQNNKIINLLEQIANK